jgi:hypothetical protein
VFKGNTLSFKAADVSIKQSKTRSQLTPYVEPELFQTRAAETVDSKDSCSRSREGNGRDKTVVASVVAKREREASCAEASYEDGTAGCRRYKSSGFQAEEPHAKAKSTQQAAETFSDVRKHQRKATEDGASEEGSNKETSLNSV